MSGGWSDGDLAELHAAALAVGARASRAAANWGSPARPTLGPARPRFSPVVLVLRAVSDVPVHALEALALCWPVLLAIAVATVHLGASDPIPPELRRGVIAAVLGLSVPLVLHAWARQRGGLGVEATLGTSLRIGPRELTATLVFAAILALTGLIGAFVAALVRAFFDPSIAELAGAVVAGIVFVQWSTVVVALGRDDDRSPIAVLRDALPALPGLALVAAPLALVARYAGVGAAERLALVPAAAPIDLVLVGHAALLLLVTLAFASALAYAVAATAPEGG